MFLETSGCFDIKMLGSFFAFKGQQVGVAIAIAWKFGSGYYQSHYMPPPQCCSALKAEG